MTKRIQRPPILKPDELYTFRRYFELRFAPADILRELEASLTRAAITLPDASVEQFTRLPDLRQRLEEAIARVSLTSESARREVLIAPILLEVAHQFFCGGVAPKFYLWGLAAGDFNRRQISFWF